jgi:hypothetical protein
VTLVTSEDDLVSQYGKPNNNTHVDFFTAANFLGYTNALRFVRVSSASLKNAADGPSGIGAILIKNDETFAITPPTANTFYAKYAGQDGDKLTIELCDHAGHAGGAQGFENWWPNTYFTEGPGTSQYALERSATGDELHIAVIDSNTGFFSGTANAVLELYPFVSAASDAKNDAGESNYFKEVINQKSNYIRIADPDVTLGVSTYGTSTDITTTFANTAGGKASIALSGGADGPTNFTLAEYRLAYDHFNDPEQEDVSLILAGGGGGAIDSDTDKAQLINYVIDLATTRKDAVTFYSPHKSDVVTETTSAGKLNAILGTSPVTGFRTAETNKNTSYAFMDSGWKYQYDKYNDVYRWIPLNGDIAGLAARTDSQRDAWWSFAGYNRGQIKNLVKLAYNPSKAHRDALYKKQVNPVVTFPGQGTLLYGDKTSQTRPSAFDRINVRRLFIVLEKAISTAAKFSLFEFNDDFTRAQFRNMVEPFLRDIKGRRGINEFKVVCDETNNPGSVIDRNEFVGDIYIKPARSINFIQLNFVAVATGVDFSEVVGKF